MRGGRLTAATMNEGRRQSVRLSPGSEQSPPLGGPASQQPHVSPAHPAVSPDHSKTSGGTHETRILDGIRCPDRSLATLRSRNRGDAGVSEDDTSTSLPVGLCLCLNAAQPCERARLGNML